MPEGQKTQKIKSAIQLGTKPNVRRAKKLLSAIIPHRTAMKNNTPTLKIRFQLFASLPFLVCLPFFFCLSAFRRPSSKAGRGVAFLKLAAAKRRRWLVLGEFAKYAFFWPDKEKSGF